MTQSMQCSAFNDGLCYLLEEKQREQRFDQILQSTKEIELTKAELIEKLKAAGKLNPKGYKKCLQTMCKNLGISTKVCVNQVLQGWVNKPKGSLQILYERGWIHPHKIHLYTKRGKIIGGITPGNLEPNEELSLCELMKKQNDFINEVTLLQYYGDILGIVVDHIPKCHPELAGEGIEYSWAIAKLHY